MAGGRPPEGHGVAVQNSPYAITISLWLSKEPRMTPGRIRKRLIERYGARAAFSEPTIRAWVNTIYPSLVEEAFQGIEGQITGVVSSNSSKLFGSVVDTLDYHLQMIQLLEDKMKDVDKEYESVKKALDATKDASEIEALTATANKLRGQTIKFSVEIRKYKVYVDEWKRTHEIGERMGDILMKMVSLSLDVFLPHVPKGTDVERENFKDLVSQYTDGWQKIGKDFGVPADRI